MRRFLRTLGGLAGALGLLTAAGCSIQVDPRIENPSEEIARPLTVGTFGRVTTTDPAAATDTGSTVYALNVFQRLMTVEVGSDALKPDAATDCWYIDPLTYSCGIRKNLSFTNGNPLTASDVKFSIERAKRLNVPGSSARLLDSIDRIVVPETDAWRIDFKLSHHDRAIGYALASPAASIVDEDAFEPDELWPQGQQPVSSGPFFADVATLDELQLLRYPRYGGAHGAALRAVTLKTYSTPELLQRAIATRTVDVLWRVPAGLVPDDGSFRTEILPGAAVQRLVWNPASADRDDTELRAWVRDATTPLRSLAAPVPQGARFSAETFRTGGDKPAGDVRGELTLAFDTRLPGQAELAGQVRAALEPEVTVRLTGDDPSADLRLDAGQAWTNTTMAWLQPYVEHPLPGREADVRELELAYRTATGLPEAQAGARRLQEAVAQDATVLPLSQTDEVFWMVPGVVINQERATWLGPCWQLGLWGFQRA